MNPPAKESQLIAQLREADTALRNAGIRDMLIGGVAANIHGYLRATHVTSTSCHWSKTRHSPTTRAASMI